ncbi:putative leucine-rich repeat-containing protein DDB_G0290503 isoform X2 [Pieris rapae]|uniref:putative leucine-rich repeat-containing protein DDB_G0290503 isoform X2 n=1 Tax=Pieris rapae TaxID=64459 RepID=UPI001E2818C1|nr:putative leucine-rich repeat-containing protein DDB_G0290503 isoform X2 [Pieris rapae]
MFSKAKRFETIAPVKSQHKLAPPKEEKVIKKSVALKPKVTPLSTPKKHSDTHSQCSSVQSLKSFMTPKPVKSVIKSTSTQKINALPKSTAKKVITTSYSPNNLTLQDDLIKAHEAEIRNKDYTILEYNKQIEELKIQTASLKKVIEQVSNGDINIQSLIKNFNDCTLQNEDKSNSTDDLKKQIYELEQQCSLLGHEVNHKQIELASLEELITIRDSLCSDLQKKLSDTESCLEETKQRLEMVKGHHALALEANESIRREYKLELETLKAKIDEEKQSIISKCKADQENTKIKFNVALETIKNELVKEKDEKIYELTNKLFDKEKEMKAKLEQIDEATREKLKLCEIQFEERSSNIQESLEQKHKELYELHNEAKNLKANLTATEEKYNALQKELDNLKDEKETMKNEKLKVVRELDELREENKLKMIEFENEINRLTVEVDKAVKEKSKFELSLSVTRDIVQVLTMRLRESDNELEHLENQVQSLTNSKEVLEEELTSYKSTLNNAVMECNEYKEALVNILKSKAALAKEHNRIMEHNVTLIESLQNVEKEAYRELGSIKSELIEDVELIKKESNSQIKLLRDEVEKKRVLCELATEHAGQASAAAEQSRLLLGQAAAEITRLENENQCLQQQIQDQQSLVVELSLLRQENEELTMNIAKQTSLLDKMKKDAEVKPKSPLAIRKSQKIGKENVQIISPLRERNH